MSAREPANPDPGMPDPAARPAPATPAGPVFDARIEPGGQRFAAPAGLPLLLAAESSGLTVTSSCRNGSCRACICQLLSGRVMYRIEWPGLSRDEKAAGCILPCVAYPVSDVVIGPVGSI